MKFFAAEDDCTDAALLALQRLYLPHPLTTVEAAGYGDLVPDPEGLLDLPAGFSHQVISWAGQRMDDGWQVPGHADGMAAFTRMDGKVVLLRNHENMPGESGPFGSDPGAGVPPGSVYDGGAGTPGPGGVTTLVYDPATQDLCAQFLSLAGTWRNCSGGKTPWGTWISCEEVVAPAGCTSDGYRAERDHGYAFEVPVGVTPSPLHAVPLTAMGRFNHEAVAVDRQSGYVYQTEDRDDGLLYRFLPDVPGDLAAGGRLQALRVQGRPRADTRNWGVSVFPLGDRVEVEWVDLHDVTCPEGDDLRYRGREDGAAIFARGEGMWAGTDAIYFACTNGGGGHLGQIWCLRPTADGGRLRLLLEPDDPTMVANADSLAVAPWGDLILAEDRNDAARRLIGVDGSGNSYVLARVRPQSEVSGICFAADGSTMFCNLRDPGLTLAITGPFC